MNNSGSSSRYVDYTSGSGGYREEDDRYPPYGYDPPDRPPRHNKSADRSMGRNRSRENLDRSRDRLEISMDSDYERQERSMNASYDRRDRSLDRLERGERGMGRRERSYEHLESGEKFDRSLERSLDRMNRRDRIVERSLDRRDRSLERRERDMARDLERKERSMDRSIDRRDRSMERSIERRDRSMDRSLDRRTKSPDGRSMDRRHRSRSRENLDDSFAGQVYLHPNAAMDRAPSDRAESEFTARNDTHRNLALEEEERRAASRAASEIYASTRFPRPQSEMSQYTYRSGRGGSDVVSVKTKTTANGKLVMETMTAPHPCCPNTRSCCCLMILLNLGLLLITLGFVVVLQLYEPPFVWYVGLSMLIFGFLVLFGSLIYCVFVCQEVEKLRPPPGELYWTNRWSKTVRVPEIHYSNTQHRPSDYRGSEFSFKTEPSRITAENHTASSLTRY